MLVVIAIIAILAALLFPVLTQAKERAKTTACSNNLKQLAHAVQIYLDDYDQRFPLAVTLDVAAGTYRTGEFSEFPNAWRSSQTGARHAENRTHWSSAIYPYIENHGIYACPSGADDRLPGVPDYGSPLVPPRYVSYTYNGLLHSYPASSVAAPDDLPLFWEGLGKVRVEGFAVSSPQLNCTDLGAVCFYVPGSAPGGTLMPNLRSQWVHNKGVIFTFVRTGAKFRRLGAQVQPLTTDRLRDPWETYDAGGIGQTQWLTPGAFRYPYLFRPDYAFDE
ncbi:MAG: DUF1559 domain-containing protein [Armatimonadetes bacterium]|nr:DUF1559 domain-containing protein [Armatimonadota bacterium]